LLAAFAGTAFDEAGLVADFSAALAGDVVADFTGAFAAVFAGALAAVFAGAGALAAVFAGALAGVFEVALVGFDGTNEPLVIGQARTGSPEGHEGVRGEAVRKGRSVEHCHTPRAFPRTGAGRGDRELAGGRRGV
jgi:hypothetical protein